MDLVFPARAGMSRGKSSGNRGNGGFPRVSGDEPLIVAAYEARVPWADICLATGLTWQAAYNAYQRAIKRWTRE